MSDSLPVRRMLKNAVDLYSKPTPSLVEQLKQVLKFDESALGNLKGWERTVFMNGMLTQRDRTHAVLQALLALAEAAEFHVQRDELPGYCRDALAKLKQAVEKAGVK